MSEQLDMIDQLNQVDVVPEAVALDPTEVDVNALTEPQDTKSQAQKNTESAQLAAVRSQTSDQPSAVQDYMAAKGVFDKDQAMEDALMASFDNQRRAIVDYVSQSWEESPQKLQTEVEIAQEMDKEVQDKMSSPVRKEVGTVDSVSPVDVTSMVKREAALQLAIANDVHQLLSNQGIGDKLADMVGYFIPMSFTQDVEDLLDMPIASEVMGEGDGFNLGKFVTDWHKLPYERRQELWPEMKASILKATGTDGFTKQNLTKAAVIFEALMDPAAAEYMNTEMAMDAVFLGMDIAGLGAINRLGARLSRRAIKENGVAKVASKTGNDELAADLNAAAVVDDTAAEAAGVSKQEAVTNGMPIDSQQPIGVRPIDEDPKFQEHKKATKKAKNIVKAKQKEFDDELQRVIEEEGPIDLGDTKSILDQNANLKAIAKELDQAVDNYHKVKKEKRKYKKKHHAEAAKADEALPQEDHSVPGFKFVVLPDAEDLDDAANNPNPGAIPGIAKKNAQRLQKLQQDSEGVVLSFTEEGELLKIGAIKKPERVRVQETALERMSDKAKEDIFVEQGLSIENARVSKDSPSGFEIVYDVVDKDGNVVASEAGTFAYTLDDVTGNFNATMKHLTKSTGRASSYPTSPSWWAQVADADDTVKVDFFDTFRDAGNLDDIVAQASDVLNELLTRSVKPVRGPHKAKARKRVLAVLEAGDEAVDEATGQRGRWFSIEELRAGIPVRPKKDGDPLTVKLQTDDEIEAYLGMKNLSETFFRLENYALRRKLEMQKVKEVEVQGRKTLGTTFETEGAAKASIQGDTRIRIHDNVRDEVINYSDEAIQRAYGEGKKLVRVLEPEEIVDGTKGKIEGSREHVDYLLVDKVNELPDIVMHQRQGYVTKINQGVEWLVEVSIPSGMRNGTEYPLTKTVRFLSNEKDAKDLAAQLNETAKPGEVYAPRKDRAGTVEQQLVDQSASRSGAGLYTGARSSDDIMYGLSEQQTERLNPIEAFQRNTRHLATHMSRNEWRLGEEQRWLNTARQWLGNDKVGTFEGTDLPNNEIGRSLEQLRNRIKVWNSIPTREETAFQGWVQGLHDVMLHKGLRPVSQKFGLEKESVKSLLWLKHSDPTAAAKSAVFNMYLGTGMPVQLYVQSQAAVIALSRYPKEGPRAIAYAFRMGILDNIENKQARRKHYARMAAEGEEFKLIEEVHQAWLRSGLGDSVRTNADLTAAKTGVGYSMSGFRRVWELGLIPFQIGEKFNRRTSFTVSYTNWKRNNPGKMPTDDDLKNIINEAKVSMLDLGKANAARWQGGPDATFAEQLFGTMTQFGQVVAKTTELAVGKSIKAEDGTQIKGWSASHKAKIATGQLVMFGAAGVPLLKLFNEEFFRNQGIDPTELDPVIIKAWNEGLTGALFMWMFDADVDVGSRAAIAGNAVNWYKDLLTGQMPVTLEGLGAFGDLAGRTAEVIRKTYFTVGAPGMEGHDLTAADYKLMIETVGEDLMSIPSFGRALLKGHMMANQHMITDRKSRVVVMEDFSKGTEWFARAGFKPSAESNTRIIQLDNQSFDAKVSAVADLYMMNIHKHLYIRGEDEASRHFIDTFDKFMTLHVNDDNIMHAVRKQLKKRIYDTPTTLRERELNKFYTRTVPNEIAGSLNQVNKDHRSLIEKLTQEKALIQPVGQIKGEQ